jgi:Mg/Co/Ni transporter MgtE
LRPAQIADLVEGANKRETAEILKAVHADRELEADVFEEMDADRQVQVLRDRSNAEIAEVLGNMRPDDAADLIAELPQNRRLATLTLLSPATQAKIRGLLGYNPATAGGLMNPDFLALPADTPVGAAVDAVRQARTVPAEVLATVYVTTAGVLSGALPLAVLLQADPAARLGEVADPDPVRVGPQADVTEVAVKMTDYNLLTIPVVHPDQHMLGVITVDDVLEATVPEDWWRREDGVEQHDLTPPARSSGPSGAASELT